MGTSCICSHASRYFFTMISMDTFTTMLCYSIMYTIILCALSVVYRQRECMLIKGQIEGVHIRAPMGSCARTWTVYREVLHIQFYLDRKERPRPCHDVLWKDRPQTWCHVIVFPNLNRRVTQWVHASPIF